MNAASTAAAAIHTMISQIIAENLLKNYVHDIFVYVTVYTSLQFRALAWGATALRICVHEGCDIHILYRLYAKSSFTDYRM